MSIKHDVNDIYIDIKNELDQYKNMSSNKGAEVQMLTKKISELEEEMVANLKQDIKEKNTVISNSKVSYYSNTINKFE